MATQDDSQIVVSKKSDDQTESWANEEQNSDLPSIPDDWKHEEAPKPDETAAAVASTSTSTSTSTTSGIGRKRGTKRGLKVQPVIETSAGCTSSVRIVEPTNAQVYAALAACGLIKRDNAPPEDYKNGSDLQYAFYIAHYENPRGIACKPNRDAVHTCWKMTTTCLYARIIAIIYELTDHVMTKERIEAINFSDFNSVYSQLVGFTGNHWFGVYPIYENAALHIKEFSHQCMSACPIAHFQHELKNVDKNIRPMLQEYAVDHMTMYKHPMASANRPRYNDSQSPAAQFGQRAQQYQRNRQSAKTPAISIRRALKRANSPREPANETACP